MLPQLCDQEHAALKLPNPGVVLAQNFVQNFVIHCVRSCFWFKVLRTADLQHKRSAFTDIRTNVTHVKAKSCNFRNPHILNVGYTTP